MNTRHLQVFLTVCETGNMTRAARQLYMTQPAVSQMISDLEKEYAVRLFERMNHRLYLTAAGLELRSYASHMLNLADQAKRHLAELGAAGAIKVGASQTVGSYLLPAILREYRRQMPSVDVYSLVDNTQVIEDQILDDQIDLGIVEGTIRSKYIQTEMLCTDDLTIICGPDHPFCRKETVQITELVDQEFFIREQGSGTRELLIKILSDAGVPWKVAGVYNNTEAIKNAVSQNLMLAAVPRISIVNEKQRGLVCELNIPGLNLRRLFHLAYHRQKYFTTAIQSFMETCKAVAV